MINKSEANVTHQIPSYKMYESEELSPLVLFLIGKSVLHYVSV